jgi:hypothetical protein
LIAQNNQGTSPPETPQRKYNSIKCYLVLPTRYSRGSIPLFRGVSRRDRVFPLRTPKSKYIVPY